MSVTMIQDGVYGDTGKGKVSHVLSSPDRCDVRVRAVGGGNAGHVIMEGTRKVALHVLPAGSAYEEGESFLGRGMVTHIPTIFSDAAAIQEQFGVDPLTKLKIAAENHILFNGHKKADLALEERRGKSTIGVTGSGIGPAYADKALRVGMRFEQFKQPIALIMDGYSKLVKHWAMTYGVHMDSTSQDQDIDALKKAKELLERTIVATGEYWRAKFARNIRVLIEGAQGSNLSADSEGYPYVTSSATTTLGHLQGAGIPHRELSETILTAKAYTTRVGNGPFPTQINGDLAKHLQDKGGEKGSTTGRVRSVGWLDAYELAHRAQEESADSLAILKGDVLDDFPGKIQMATGRQDGNPTYEEFDGWTGLNGKRTVAELHPNYQSFLRRISQITRTKIAYIGTGRDAADLIHVS